jgi:tRNA A37 threonylcarbamoyladenosine dehydratase
MAAAAPAWPDLERRFGGLRRLYGDAGYERLRRASVAVVGLGGVGSWAVEAMARCGVAALTLIDLDHVAESNVNRQVQALESTLGQAKAQALGERIAAIHPRCVVTAVEAFVEPGNWPALLPAPVEVLIDACDQVSAKLTLAAWGLQAGVPVVCVGAAGGKRQAVGVQVGDLLEVTHDPLLASLRQRLRKLGLLPGAGLPQPAGRAAKPRPSGLRCVYSREPVTLPARADGEACSTDGSLNCHGYGSSVVVTASFGMAAAGEAISQLLHRP